MDPAPGPTGTRPRVLFVGNDQSSPEIAASLLRRLVGEAVEIRTAGAQPLDHGGRADDILVQMGLNPASEERLSARALTVADRVVVLGTGLDVARVTGRRYEEWDVAEEDLGERVRALAAELLAPAPTTRGGGPGGRLDRVRTRWSASPAGRVAARVADGVAATLRKVGLRPGGRAPRRGPRRP